MTTLSEQIEAADKAQPIVNPEFESLLDTQGDVSYDELKKLIQRDGIRDPIIVWDETNTVLDGHTRLKIGKELDIVVPQKRLSFKDETEAKEWIIRNQLGRRNLTEARFSYYVGKLYNESKMVTSEEKIASPGGQNTADRIGKEVGLSPKTVRRYGTQSKAVDLIERVKGKAAKIQELSKKPEYTAEEKTAIASAPNVTVAAKTIKNMDDYKAKKKATKVEAKKTQAAIAEKKTVYNIVLSMPDFDASGFSVTTEPKPAMDKEAIVYMVVPDEYLSDAIDLIKRWGLTYEASIIYYSSKTYDGIFSKIAHQFVLLASKGQITGPVAGKESASCNLLNGDIGPAVVKLIETYHPNGGLKKLDMRRGAKTPAGWDKL